jgi:hypothetical protein
MNLGYATAEQQELLSHEVSELGRILNGLITSLQQKQTHRQLLATSHWPLTTISLVHQCPNSPSATFR